MQSSKRKSPFDNLSPGNSAHSGSRSSVWSSRTCCCQQCRFLFHTSCKPPSQAEFSWNISTPGSLLSSCASQDSPPLPPLPSHALPSPLRLHPLDFCHPHLCQTRNYVHLPKQFVFLLPLLDAVLVYHPVGPGQKTSKVLIFSFQNLKANLNIWVMYFQVWPKPTSCPPSWANLPENQSRKKSTTISSFKELLLPTIGLDFLIFFFIKPFQRKGCMWLHLQYQIRWNTCFKQSFTVPSN